MITRERGTPDGSGHNSPAAKPIDFDKMAEFDGLPEPIRRALAVAPRSFNPRMVREHWQKSGLSPEAYAARVMPEMIVKQLSRTK